MTHLAAGDDVQEPLLHVEPHVREDGEASVHLHLLVLGGFFCGGYQDLPESNVRSGEVRGMLKERLGGEEETGRKGEGRMRRRDGGE